VSRPMREPSFTETMQLGIVVRDLEATVRRYEDDYGISPWRFDRIDLGAANDRREYGRPVERSNRIAIAMVGRVMWELIEPLDEDGIYVRFLAEKGEVVHHVAVAATLDFDETFARAERKDGMMLSCKHSGIDIAYLDTLRDLGVTIEIFSGNGGCHAPAKLLPPKTRLEGPAPP
jgi:Glyoxalase/Bleomycin resistance protein/Dioxygenase superfamily